MIADAQEDKWVAFGVTYYSADFQWWADCKDGSARAEGTGTARGLGFEGTLFEVSTEIAGTSSLHFVDRARGRELGGTYAGIRLSGEIDMILVGAGVSGAVLFDLDDLSTVLGYETSMTIGISLDAGLVRSLREGAAGVAGASGLRRFTGILRGLLAPDLGAYAEYLVLDYQRCLRE